MIDFGTERSIITTYKDSQAIRTLKSFRVRIKVKNAREEMTEYIRFTDELKKLREANLLASDDKDASTRVAFELEYPKKNVDGSYFVIKCYTIVE